MNILDQRPHIIITLKTLLCLKESERKITNKEKLLLKGRNYETSKVSLSSPSKLVHKNIIIYFQSTELGRDDESN